MIPMLLNLVQRFMKLMTNYYKFGDELSSDSPDITGTRGEDSASGVYTRVVRRGVPRAHGGGSNNPLVGIPFILIIAFTIGLGGFNGTRAYKKQKDAHPSHNPFLP